MPVTAVGSRLKVAMTKNTKLSSIISAWVGLSLIALAALFSLCAWSQTQLATVSGTITDPSGAVVPGVSVTIVSQGTGLKRSALTDTAGEYRFAGLPTGSYSLRIEKTGFQSQMREGVELEFGCRSEGQFATRSRRHRTTNDGQRERCRDR